MSIYTPVQNNFIFNVDLKEKKAWEERNASELQNYSQQQRDFEWLRNRIAVNLNESTLKNWEKEGLSAMEMAMRYGDIMDARAAAQQRQKEKIEKAKNLRYIVQSSMAKKGFCETIISADYANTGLNILLVLLILYLGKTLLPWRKYRKYKG